jgi:uncharacterized coiled-coil DUF342 family protein
MNEYEELYDELLDENNFVETTDPVTKKINEIENQHLGILSEEQKLRKDDRETINKKINEYKKQIKKLKNHKGTSKTVRNVNANLAQQRKKLNEKIYELKAKIEDLNIEEEGSQAFEQGLMKKKMEEAELIKSDIDKVLTNDDITKW